MRTKVLQVKWIVSIVVRNVDCYWLSLMSVSFFVSHENFRNWTTCFCFILCNLQTAVLAAATLLFLIALPLVNCSRRNTLRIEELDDNLSVKGYDHGKRESTMNQEMNAYFRRKDEKRTLTEKFYSIKDVCRMLSRATSKCNNNRSREICDATDSKEYSDRMINCGCKRGIRKQCIGCQIHNSLNLQAFD